jgi:hypothetical protein
MHPAPELLRRFAPRNDDVSDRSRDAPGTRVLFKQPTFSALRTDLRQIASAVVAGAVTISVSSHDVRKKKGQRNADRRRSVSTVPFGTARALQSALAHRRSTTALT